MPFKQDFVTALRSGKDYGALLSLVQRYQAQGLSAQDAYQTLQQIWFDFGFDKGEQRGSLQDNLEAVMEKVWYECPA